MSRVSLPDESSLVPVIEDALRTAPLAPPPPLLYAAVMNRIRPAVARPRAVRPHGMRPSAPPPPFRIAWLDLAISLFASGMLGVVWLVWRWLPPTWVGYMQMEIHWQLQKLWYLDSYLLLGSGVSLAALLAGIIFALWSCTRSGSCTTA